MRPDDHCCHNCGAGIGLLGPRPLEGSPVPKLRSVLVAITLALLAPLFVVTGAAAQDESTPIERIDLPTASSGEQVTGELRQNKVDPFTLVAVTWQGSLRALDAEVRVDGEDGWSDWQQLTLSEEAEGEARGGSEPLWVGEATGFEVRLRGTGAASDVQVSLIRSETRSTDTQQRPQVQRRSAANGAAQPVITTRAQWGADERLITPDCVAPNIASTLKAGVVHHTAGSNNYTAAQAAAQLRGIYAYHVRDRGWCDIGYNFLVDKYGKIYEGRHGGIDKPIVGAHAGGWNTATVGVSIMMNSDTMKPTDVSLEAMVSVFAWKFSLHGIDPMGKTTLNGRTINTIEPHKALTATDCPGVNLSPKLDWIRQRTAQLMGTGEEPDRSPISDRWAAEGGANGPWGAMVGGIKETADGGSWADFANVTAYASPTGEIAVVQGRIRDRWKELGGATSGLGLPRSNETAGPHGSRVTTFEHGRMIWTLPTDAQPIYGWFNSNYDRLSNAVGVPTSGEYLRQGRIVQDFTRGRFYLNNGSLHAVYGTIWDRYNAMGADESALGLPVSSEETGPAGSRQTRFANGRMVWRIDTGAQPVLGWFGANYEGLSTALGVPTSGEYLRQGRIVQDFENGRIYLNGNLAAVYGRIWDQYAAMGADQSWLGLPLGSEEAGPNGSRQVRFEHGTLRWTLSGGVTILVS
ncbi:hypothetical protein CGZ92_01640 [Parenemella sanctibonifatiensis]|uniref:Peptidoglycan recognition protein family domain-containing protein n=1 Tax=Parenemella sanctibonifatiensis TaxID=2016505 RepID=A0A255EPA8_9ACTN|nr:hypothetical protein CGZ92_01640 [Parenemella sanctibonifatiensis]